MHLLSLTSLCQSVDEKETENKNETVISEERNMATRESRMSLDSGFSDEKQIRKQKHKRARNKSKQRRKLCKDDIGKPLVESYSHMAHIGSGGDCFGEISSDMTKLANSEKSAKFSDSETSMSRTTSASNSEVDAQIRLRPHASGFSARTRHSVMSWNLELGQVDILESVLAVMDKLKQDKPVLESPSEQDENSEDSFPQSPTPPVTPPPSVMTNRSSPATTINEEPIYDQVPTTGTEVDAAALIQRTETIYERIPTTPTNNNPLLVHARPKFRPPPPVPEPQQDVIYDFVGSSPVKIEN